MTQILKSKFEVLEAVGKLLAGDEIPDWRMAISLYDLNDLFYKVHQNDPRNIEVKSVLGDPDSWWEVSTVENNEILQKANADDAICFEDGHYQLAIELLAQDHVLPMTKGGETRRFQGKDGGDYMMISYKANYRLPNDVGAVLFKRIPKAAVFYHRYHGVTEGMFFDDERILFSGLENDAIEFADKMMQGFGKTVNEATESELMGYQGAMPLPSGGRPYFASTDHFDIVVAGE